MRRSRSPYSACSPDDPLQPHTMGTPRHSPANLIAAINVIQITAIRPGELPPLQSRLQMNWARKGVLILLAAAICWSGLPGSDCLLTAQPMMQSDCCQAMASNCPMPDAGMSFSCCSTQPQNTSIAQDTSYSPEHPQKIFLAPHSVSIMEAMSSDSVAQITVEAPPPRLTTGISILRI